MSGGRDLVVVGGRHYPHVLWLETFNGAFLEHLDARVTAAVDSPVASPKSVRRAVGKMKAKNAHAAIYAKAVAKMRDHEPTTPQEGDVIVAVLPAKP